VSNRVTRCILMQINSGFVLTWCGIAQGPTVPVLTDLQHVMALSAYYDREVTPCPKCLERISDVALTEIERVGFLAKES
jgi:hypothetical protein